MVELFSLLAWVADEQALASFVPRVQGVQGSLDKEQALEDLRPSHQQEVEDLGFGWQDLKTAEQVHGAEVVQVDSESPFLIEGCDGLMTKERGVLLGIYVADCGLIWLRDRVTGGVALLHSGKKGTEGNILKNAVEQMRSAWGSKPSDIVGVLGPCIRPPHYEVDFAASIREQAENCGLGDFRDCRLCTGSDLKNYYSYRQEKGKTGRMLGLFGIR